MNDLVSVIVTAYNTQDYISEAIQSVIDQTYPHWELILVDDGSSDDTGLIMKKYASEYERIHTFAMPKNSGIPAANNYGLEFARGSFYAKLDADDSMLPTRLEKQVKYLEDHPKVTMVSGHAYFITSSGRQVGKQVMPGYIKPEDTAASLADNRLIVCAHSCFMAYMDKVREVGGYNTAYFCAEDIDLFTRMAENGNILVIMQEPLIRYRVHKQSFMAVGGKMGLVQETTDLIYENAQRRRNGMKEITLEEFVRNLPETGRIDKWKRSLHNYSVYYRRMALIHYGDRAYVKFIIASLITVLIDPRNILAKIKTRLKFRSATSLSQGH